MSESTKTEIPRAPYVSHFWSWPTKASHYPSYRFHEKGDIRRSPHTPRTSKENAKPEVDNTEWIDASIFLGFNWKLHIWIPQLASSLVFSQFLSVNLKVTVSWVVTAVINHDKYIALPSKHETSEIFSHVCKTSVSPPNIQNRFNIWANLRSVWYFVIVPELFNYLQINERVAKGQTSWEV